MQPQPTPRPEHRSRKHAIKSHAGRGSTSALCIAAAIVAASGIVPSANAAVLTWDANGAAGGIGGSGSWDTLSSTWNDGTAVWNNTTPDSAIFSGTPGVVNLLEPITASGLNFSIAGYTLDLAAQNLTVASGTTTGTGVITNTSATVATLSVATLAGTGPTLSGNLNVVYNGGAWTPSIDHSFTGTLSLLGNGLVRTDGVDIGVNSSSSLLRLGGTGNLQLGAAAGYSRTYARNIELLGTVAGIQPNGGQILTLTGSISGTGNFVRTAGQGLVILAGNNTFTGKVTSLTGNAVIVAASPTAFGAANVDPLLNVVEGGGNSNTVGFLGGVDVNGAKNITVGGSVRPDGLGTIHNFGGINSFAGNITMSNQQMFVVEPNSQLTLKGVLGGSRALVKQGDGTLVLANAMTYGFTSNGEFRRLTRVVNGKLVLDFSQPTSPLNNIINSSDQSGNSSPASLAGGILEVRGKPGTVEAPITNTQFFQAWRVDIGASLFNIVTAANNTVSVRLGGLTTRVIGGTVDFGLPSGPQVNGTNGFNTTKLNTNGIIGGYATVNKVAWATSGTTGTNAITEYIHSASEQSTGAFDVATNNVDFNDTIGAPAADRTINSLRFSTGGALTLQGTNNVITSGGILMTGGTPAVISGGTLRGAASTDLVVHQYSAAPLIIASTISDNTAATGLTKSGNGMLVLSGTNDYTGPTLVHSGVLKLDSAGALPANSRVSLRGGVLGITSDFTRSLGTGGTNVEWLGSGGFAAFGGDRNVNIGGAGATMVWNNNSVSSGTWEPGTATTIATEGMYFGGLFVGSNYKLMFGSSDATGAVVFQNPINLAGGNNVPLTRGIEVADSPALAVEARLTGTLSGTFVGINKTGPGTLELTGANSYTGATVVAGGVLRVTGSLSANSAVSVLDAGTLGGTGTVGAVTLQAGGTLAPGESAGVLTTGSLLLSGGTLAAELTDAFTYDRLNVSGTVSFTSPVNLTLTLASTFAPDTKFTLIDNNLFDAIALADPLARFVFEGNPLEEGEVFAVAGGFGSQSFQISYAGGTDANDVVLTAIPEPSAALMVLAGVGCLVTYQRRRNPAVSR